MKANGQKQRCLALRYSVAVIESLYALDVG